MLGALALIQNRIATALGKEVPFNEVLSAAYMEKQKMAVSDITSAPSSVRLTGHFNKCCKFHSDSERGLGPTVASLSLGSAAEMHFRLHSKYADTESPRKIAMSLLLRHVCSLNLEVEPYFTCDSTRATS